MRNGNARLEGDAGIVAEYAQDSIRRNAVNDAEPGNRPVRERAAFIFPLAALMLGATVALIPLLSNPRAYFRDDLQSQYMPIFAAVGRNLLTGHFPTLTLQMQNGGALLAEYQYGMLNPISLAGYAVASLSNDLPATSAVLAVFHIALLCLGTYLLARQLRSSREMALAAAVAFAANNFIFYWYATSWFPGLISMAWFVWAAAFLVRAGQDRWSWAAGIAFTYLTVTSGWPHAVLALGLFGTVWALVQWRRGEKHSALATMASLLFGGLIAAPAVFPVFAMSSVSARPTGLLNNSDMVANLYALAGVSSPFQLGHIKWGALLRLATPIFYCAWFVIPLMPFIDFRRFLIRIPAVEGLSILVVITILATQGPDTIGTLRTPIRFVPFLHLYLLLLFSAVASISAPWKITRNRLCVSACLVAFGALSAIQIQPDVWVAALLGSGLISYLLVSFIFSEHRFPRATVWVLVLGTLVTLLATRTFIPVNRNLPEWSESDPSIHPTDLGKVPHSYTFLIAPFGAFIDESVKVPFGAMPLTQGQPTITGYSPIGLRSFADTMCVEPHGLVCAEAADKLFMPTTLGPPLADLLRIDRIDVYRGHAPKVPRKKNEGSWSRWTTTTQHLISERAQAELDRNWVETADVDHIRTYVRRTQKAWPTGSITWTTPNLDATSVEASATKERVDVRGVSSGPSATIVFTRLAWPGYHAEFNGRPVRVVTGEGFLTAVELPAGSQVGTVVLWYEPPLIRPALLICGIGLIGFLLGLLFWTPLLNGRPPGGTSLAEGRR